jgi:hypothetical protein
MMATTRTTPPTGAMPVGAAAPARLAKRRAGGSLRQRRDGVWEARLYRSPGKRQSVYGPTREAVAAKLAALQALQDRDRARALAPTPLHAASGPTGGQPTSSAAERKSDRPACSV